MKILEAQDIESRTPSPAWFKMTRTNGEQARPVIRCRCGALTNIRNHHVHRDGRVTASYFHDRPGCGFHEYIELDGYDGPEFLPGEDQGT